MTQKLFAKIYSVNILMPGAELAGPQFGLRSIPSQERTTRNPRRTRTFVLSQW